MTTLEKHLIESRGYVIFKIGGTERAFKNPMVFKIKPSESPNMGELLTRSFMTGLLSQPVRVLTPRALEGKTSEEKDLMVLELMNS